VRHRGGSPDQDVGRAADQQQVLNVVVRTMTLAPVDD
jgi:anionic cell wall polymer biosynthesis LytR-Cps2A-Psr (LCP) family protein